MRQIAEEWAAEQRELAEQQKRAEEEARLRKEEENRIADLMDILNRWRLSRDVRQWLKETKKLITSHDATATAGGPIDLWLEAYPTRIDPAAPSVGTLKEIQAMKSPGKPPGER